MSETEAPPRELRTGAKLFLSVAILALGLGAAMVAIKLKKPPQQAPTGNAALPVETVRVTSRRQPVSVWATGTVIPARQVVIGSEVAGRVVDVSGELVPGGRFRSGEAMLRIDSRDYKLAAQMQSAQVAMARTELAVEQTRKELADKEWKLMGEAAAPGSLARREPQLQAAQSAVSAAESGLRRSRLAVSKAALRAPFNAIVVTRQTDLGQVVAPGTPLATLAGTDEFWITVTVPQDKLAFIAAPGIAGQKSGANVTVRQESAGQVVKRVGTVVRIAGDLDPIGRMAKVIVAVADPLSLRGTELPPLLLNTFVEVEIEGNQAADAFEIPRAALRDQNSMWIVRNGMLDIVPVTVFWRRPQTVLVQAPLTGELAVITSPLASPVSGTVVRDVATASKPAAAAAPPSASGVAP